MLWECDKPNGRPCRLMETRACPTGREAGCPAVPCARFEETDESVLENVWAADLARSERERRSLHGA